MYFNLQVQTYIAFQGSLKHKDLYIKLIYLSKNGHLGLSYILLFVYQSKYDIFVTYIIRG